MPTDAVVICADDQLCGRWSSELRAHGWMVYDAKDVRSAIDLASKQQPQVIVTTISMPDTAARDLIRALRSVVDHDVKLVGIAEGTQVPSDVDTSGFDVLVTEPVDFAALQRNIAGGDDPDEKKKTTEMPIVKP